MAIEGQIVNDTIVAGEDLNVAAAQFKAMTVAGVYADNANEAYGLMSGDSKPKSGEHMVVNVSGLMKGVAGAAIAAGARFTVATSGYLTTVVSGSGQHVGMNKNVAVSSGSVFTFFGNVAGAYSTVGQQ